ncbi:SAM-dependent methyltransferase [Williamsia sp. 1135]|uniref:class I SAM-dependent DNA methyltransferase n=1 Tax=Williamsia sp. 1135 TaxID=1889262 RepID=UPI0011816110|nr:SAM-dependent methyltransferase [Williamsia sp. 1135]
MEESYFHEMYRDSDDPWGFTSRWYEQRKYQMTLAALSAPRYGRAFEAGCSIGVLSEHLAARCDQLLAVDLSDKAVQIAAGRLEPLGGRVVVETRDFVVDWPTGTFDLIVLSEVLYYLDPAQLDSVIANAAAALSDDGELIAVHWRWPVEEYPQTGDQVHDRLRDSELAHTAGYLDTDFRLDVFSRVDRQSVAQREGLV